MRGRIFLIAVALTCVVDAAVLRAGENKSTATYLGGTVGLFSGTGGMLSTEAEDLLFKPLSQAVTLQISFKAITAIEYGPQPGQRVPAVVIVSKKRGQYLTVNWMNDSGKEQSTVFELSKEIVGSTLAGLEAKTGKSIQYQNEEARHAGGSR